MGINAIGANRMPNTKAEILNPLAARHVDQECIEPLRGNVVVHILECINRQASLPEPFFNGRANVSQELHERTQNGDPV
jgi:hypothetical protein